MLMSKKKGEWKAIVQNVKEQTGVCGGTPAAQSEGVAQVTELLE